MDKNKAMVAYLLNCPTIKDNPMYFNFANEKSEDVQLVGTEDDSAINKPYIDGTIEKCYTIDVLVYKAVAYNSIVTQESGGSIVPSETYLDENLINLDDVQSVLDWLLEQNDIRNFPDFGEDCFIESIEPMTNKPKLNGVNPNKQPPLAQYSIGVKIKYLDTSKQLWK